MSTVLASLTEETKAKILGTSLEDHKSQHMPIPTYCYEMEGRGKLLQEHASLYSERIGFDVLPLAMEIELVQGTLLAQNINWDSGEIARDSQSRFWYENKDRLYELNRELASRLGFHFFMTGNASGTKVLKDIGTSNDDIDALYDGNRFSVQLSENRDSITSSLYSTEDLDSMIAFYDTISDARATAVNDRSAPHADRILRDQIYLYLRTLEEIVMKAADATFVHEPDQRSRYVSAYGRQVKRNSNN